MKCDYTETKRFLKLLKFDYIFSFESMKAYKYFNELYNDMSILTNSNVAIAKKYGSNYSSISEWRKELFGELKSYYRANFSRSNFEIDMELLLNELDIAFIREYMIKGLAYDFYLGHKILIELNGSYWHKDNEKADTKKINNVKEKYDLLVIDEKDFYNNKIKFRNMILKLYIENVCKEYNLSTI